MYLKDRQTDSQMAGQRKKVLRSLGMTTYKRNSWGCLM